MPWTSTKHILPRLPRAVWELEQKQYKMLNSTWIVASIRCDRETTSYMASQLDPVVRKDMLFIVSFDMIGDRCASILYKTVVEVVFNKGDLSLWKQYEMLNLCRIFNLPFVIKKISEYLD
jgi:hypothetical protein